MKKENQKALPLLALLLAAAAILLVFAAPARAGAKAGLALAENTVLPSLLPLLMLFLMIQNTRAGVLLSRALTLPAKALRLPPRLPERCCLAKSAAIPPARCSPENCWIGA